MPFLFHRFLLASIALLGLSIPFLTAQSCLSGREGNIWYFGDSLGLDFNTSPPQILTDSKMKTYEASTIVSDPAGNLLFYSNGEYVWNRNHQIMPGVQGMNKLKGNESATQILALPKPDDPNIYFLFYVEVYDNVWATNMMADTTRKMYYAIVDLTMDGGLGDVTAKDNLLFTKSTEKIAAVRHCNGQDWWVMTLESGSNRFLAWSITNAGLQIIPVVSQVGKTASPFISAKTGVLKFSPDGHLLAKISSSTKTFNGGTFDAFVELFQFDNATGLVKNPLLIEENSKFTYGMEFSPDNSKFYYNAWSPGDSLYQLDLCAYDLTTIRASKVNLGKSATSTGQMQIAPDGQIYLTSTFQKYISVIHQPNLKGFACQYEPQAIPLPRQALLGLPTFAASYYVPGKPYIAVENQCVPVCADSIRPYYVLGQCGNGATYDWLAAGGTVVAQQGDTAWIKWAQPGQQYVAVRKTWACGDRSDTLRVMVKSCALCVPVRTLLSATTCNPAQTGVDTLPLQALSGCDSLVITTTIWQPSFTIQQAVNTCNPSLAGTDTLALQSIYGCDSLIITTTTWQPSFTSQQAANTCNPALAGTDTLILQSIYGCDSLIITTTTWQPSFAIQQAAITCNLALAGTDTLALQSIYGCDSLIITTTTWQPSFTSQQAANTCNPALAGTDTLALQSIYGCDSLIITITTWQPSFAIQQAAITCNPALAGTDTLALQSIYGCDSLIITTTTWQPSFTSQQAVNTCNPALAGTDTLILQSIYGCDSLIITTTTWQPSFAIQQAAITCNPALAGTDTLILQSIYGCDSLIITTTTWQPSFTSQQAANTCNPALAGTDTLILQSIYGCDSLIITTTTWQPSFTSQQAANTCNPALAGTDTLILQSIYGCDSLIITTTTWQPSFTSQQAANTCNPALAGTDTLILQSIYGCDSLIITTTTWQPSFTIQQAAHTCNPALARTDTLALQSIYGCDSLIITTTTWQPSFTSQQAANTCNPALAGTDTLILQSIYGCDSLIITSTTWQPSFAIQQAAITCNPALAGTDTLALQSIYGCDSLIITITTWQPSFAIQQAANTCNPALAGTDTLALQSIYGCDSLIITSTTWQPSFAIQQAAITCNPALAGTDTLALQSIYGCDSLIITTTTWQPSFTSQQAANTCNPALAGTDTLILQSIYGCDSLIITSTVWVQPIVDIGGSQAIIAGDSLWLSPTTNLSPVTVNWAPPNAVSCPNCLETSAFPTSNTLFTVHLSDSSGCMAEGQILISVTARHSIYLPNVFLPGSSNGNDRFTAYTNLAQGDRIRTLIIYDRWGELLFQKNDFPANEPELGWDGASHYKSCAPGVYVYYLEMEWADGETGIYKGSLTLLR